MIGKISKFLPALLIVILLYLTSRYSYMVFHVLVEIFSTVIAASLFLFAWNTRKIIRNHYFMVISIALLFVGILDLAHAITYSGMNLILGIDANVPTQLWIASRYMLSGSFLLALRFIKRKIYIKWSIVAYFIITLLALASIFYWKIFPDSFIEGKGLTDFKIISEYIIGLILILAYLGLGKYKEYFDIKVFRLLEISIILSIVSELIFTLYISVFDVFNFWGHILKTASYFLIYKAIIETGLTQPYNLLFLELKKLNSRKDEFINIASHELKTPITSIKAYSQVLASHLKAQDSENLQIANRIDEQANKIKELVNDLLDLSRIETGRMEIKFEAIDLEKLVDKTVRDMGRLSIRHRLIKKGKIGTKINADPQRINQVVTNLINNAVKYSPEGSDVVVEMKRLNGSAILSVRDSGIGISKSGQKKIFEKYYRSKNGQSRADGLGIGLYIARQIVEKHNGKIWVESQMGKGSTFFVSLPV